MTTRTRFAGIAFLMVFTLAALWRGDVAARQASQTPTGVVAPPGRAARVPPAGQTATRLQDGRWLLVGGEGAEADASLWDPQTNVTTPTATHLQLPRAWHTATVLADGTVLVAAGRIGDTFVEVPELFDPATQTFTLLAIPGAAARASHTATLLTDGRVLIAGGTNGGNVAPPTEIWDLQARTVTSVGPVGDASRAGHTATLLPDGSVRLSGGRQLDGAPAADDVIIDAERGTIVQAPRPSADERIAPVVAGSIPASECP